MISFIQGKVIFSDGQEVIVADASGVGYQIYCRTLFAEGSSVALYLSHIIKEASEALYGFISLREKKMFELLNEVKGVGPKSAYTLISSLGVKQICDAINFEDKKSLSKAPGIGAKASAQMILDLAGKINKIKMYSNKNISKVRVDDVSYESNFMTPILSELQTDLKHDNDQEFIKESDDIEEQNEYQLLNDTIMACKELGFAENMIIQKAQKILLENEIIKAEQLVHLVLKEI